MGKKAEKKNKCIKSRHHFSISEKNSLEESQHLAPAVCIFPPCGSLAK